MLFSREMLSPLPADSRAKIARLDTARDSNHAVLLTATETWQAAHMKYEAAFSAANRHAAAAERLGVFEGEDKAKELHAAAEARRKADGLKFDLDNATHARDRATGAYRAFDFLSEAAKFVSEEIEDGGTFTHAPATPPKGVKDHRAAVAAIREELAAIDRQWAETERAPALAADLKAGLMAAVDRLAAEGAPKIAPTMRHGGDPARLADLTGIGFHSYGSNLPVQTAKLTAHLDALKSRVGFIESRLPAFVCWLMRPEIEARIGALIDAVDQTGAMSDAARDERFEELAAKRLNLERTEESLIVQAESAGMVIPRRRDADARAVLEIA